MSFQLTKGTVFEDVDGTGVLIADNGDSAVISGSAKALVDALLSSPTIEEAVEQLLEVYSTERAVLLEDAKTTFEDLTLHGMMEEVVS